MVAELEQEPGRGQELGRQAVELKLVAGPVELVELVPELVESIAELVELVELVAELIAGTVVELGLAVELGE